VIGGLAARGTGVTVVKTEHGRVEPLASWSALARHWKLCLNSLLDRLVSRLLIDAAVFVSQDIQRQAGLQTARIPERVIYNGIELPAAVCRHASPDGPDRRLFNIGIVGRIDKVKGHCHLLKAVARLNHLPGVRLQVFGSGPLEHECMRLCQEVELTERVCFHGFQESIHEHMRNLDLLVMPSLHEGLPYALLEAMYLKVPVIASRVGGLLEVIEDGKSGVLVIPSADAALAAAIERLYWNPELRGRLAQEAFGKVCREFLAAGMVRKHLDLYAQLLPELS
jgi:glycosyltransferase involved in cell wall biosynthesis